MNTENAIKEILNYFENTILFRPVLTTGGLSEPIQLKRQPKIDLVNALSDHTDGKTFKAENIEQVYDVIAGVFKKNVEEIKPIVDAFIKENGIETSKPIYIHAYLVEAG